MLRTIINAHDCIALFKFALCIHNFSLCLWAKSTIYIFIYVLLILIIWRVAMDLAWETLALIPRWIFVLAVGSQVVLIDLYHYLSYNAFNNSHSAMMRETV